MTTDELRALLRECRQELTINPPASRRIKALIIVIDAALASDFAVVPREPTEAMIRVAIERGAAGEYNEGIWKAMLAASEVK